MGQDDIPDILALNLASNDYIGHSYGPDSAEVLDVTYQTDRQLSSFFNDLDRLAGGADLRAAVIEEWRRLKELPAAALEAELRPLLGNGPIPDIGALDLARMLDEASWHLLDVLGDEGE